MRGAHHDLFARANRGRDQVVGISDQVVGLDDKLRAECMALWPAKTAVHLAIAADVTVRQAERILGRHQGFSLAVYSRLLQASTASAFCAR
ncbi:MAG: hypothetical protein M5U08_13870 [Burkholderiales bacterium]|nr:hypothetical protein [Burkholderiales bacterium]